MIPPYCLNLFIFFPLIPIINIPLSSLRPCVPALKIIFSSSGETSRVHVSRWKAESSLQWWELERVVSGSTGTGTSSTATSSSSATGTQSGGLSGGGMKWQDAFRLKHVFSKAPSLHRHYPASSLLWASPTPARND